MDVKRIRLKTLKNTRDLGGIKTQDGRYIKPRMLIRSSCLSTASSEDLAVLTEKYALSTVIDLRTDAEIDESPETLPDTVRYIRLPLLDVGFFGITRDEYSVKSWFNIFKNTSVSPESVFGDMYELIMFGENAKPYIKQFFDILLDNPSGAVLWHCSAGKDRVGLLTAVLLSVLGVERKTVIKDYLATTFFTAGSIIKSRLAAPFFLHSARLRKCYAVLLGVKREYIERIFKKIDAEYGSAENYLRVHCDISADDINSLKDKFLI